MPPRRPKNWCACSAKRPRSSSRERKRYSMANGILIFGEVRAGRLKPITRELITAANQLSQAGAGPVSLALVGEGVDAALGEAKALPVSKVYAAKHALLGHY